MLPPIVLTIEVACEKAKAFSIFTQQMAAWWPLGKRAMSLYSGGKAMTLEVEARLGGTIVEVGDDGTRHFWGSFKRFEPHDLLVLDFHMGLPPEQSGTVEVSFTSAGPGRTAVKLVHSNWEGYGDMAAMMRKGYAGSWGLILADSFGVACEAEALA